MASRIWTQRTGRLFLAFAISIAVTPVSLFAQFSTGTILGTVRDNTGGVIPGVSVTTRNTGTGLTRTTTSNEDGSYRFPGLPVGAYEVRSEQQGFTTEVRSGVTLAVGQEAVLDFALKVGAVAETVEVSAEAPLVNTTTSALGGLVNEDKIQDLPLNGRSYIDLSLMQAGVTQQRAPIGTPSTGATGTLYSSNGAPARSNSYLLDGAPMLNISGASASSVANTSLGLSGTREFKVVTNAFSAEYGMSMGSVMTIVSKGGTNDFHGELFEYLRNSALDAANFFDPTAIIQPGKRITALRRNQFGGGFGGPIRKDKTFFYATYEALIQRAGQSQVLNDFPANCFDPATRKLLATGNPCATSTLPGAPPIGTVAPVVQPFLQLYPYPNLPNNRFGYVFRSPIDEHYGQIRLDNNFPAGDSFFSRYTIDNTNTDNPFNWPQIVNRIRSRPQFLTLSHTHIFSPAFLNNARASYSRTIIDNRTITPELGLPSSNCPEVNGPCISSNSIPGTSFVCSPVYASLSGEPRGCLHMGVLNIVGVTTFSHEAGGTDPSNDVQNIFTYSDDMFYTKGTHALKFGTLVNRYQQNVISFLSRPGTASFLTIPNFFAGLANTFSLLDPAHNNELRYWRYTTLGFYFQDDIRLASRLTLNLGLRYEFNTVPREAHGANSAMLHPGTTDTVASAVVGPPFRNATLRNFGPRVGFAWDIFGNNKTALRGGFARLFDIANIGSAFVNLPIYLPFAQQFTVTAPSATNQLPLTLPLQVPPTYTPQLGLIDYYVKQPQMYQYNLSVERQLPWNQVLSIAYAGSRGLHLWQRQDANPKSPMPGSVNSWPLPGNKLFTAAHQNPNFASITLISPTADSHYNSLQVGLTKRVSHGLQFQSSYTWAKNMDDFQGIGGQEGSLANPYNRAADRGPAVFDIPHNWRFNMVYRVPSFRQGTIVGSILSDWGISAIEAWNSGYPVNVTMTTNPSGSGINNTGTDRPSVNPNFTGNRYPKTILRWFDPAAFISPPPISTPDGPVGVFGNVGRNVLRGPSFANTDLSLSKELPVRVLGDQGKTQFRFEVFNIFNHPNFGLPAGAGPYNGTSVAATAGQISTTVGDSRRIQLALKLLF